MTREQCVSTAFNETICEGSQYSLIYDVQTQMCICRETKNRSGPCLNNGLSIIDETLKSKNCSYVFSHVKLNQNKTIVMNSFRCSYPFFGSHCQYDVCSNRCDNNASCYLNGTTTKCR